MNKAVLTSTLTMTFVINTDTIHTSVDYGAVCAGPEPDTLFVAKWRLDDVARIDVINKEGDVVRTLLTDHPDLIDPFCMETNGDHLYVSDWSSHRFFKVDIATGHVSGLVTGYF
jgi:hypothetical protein